MYFENFPVIRYGSTDGTIKNVTNLLRRVAVRSKLKTNISILSDVCEALIGAIYLDSNLENAKKFISKYWKKKFQKTFYHHKTQNLYYKRLHKKKD